MSKILRRPMFRGGPVDSYNTGIASGLGQPRIGAKRGRFFGDVGNPYTAPLLMDTASVLPPIRRGRIRGPADFEANRAGTIEDAGNKTAGITTMNDGSAAGIEDLDVDGITNYEYTPSEMIEQQETIASLKEVDTPNINTEDNKNKKDDPDDVEVTMTDLEKALGLDKARRRDLGDMLGRASAAFLGAGDVREGLAEFMAAETKAGPSRTERIKSIAGLEEFKAKKAKELYESKRKEFAPGNFEKNDRYLQKKYPKLDERERLKILQKKPSTFAEQYIELSKDFGYKNADIFKDAAFLYFGNDYVTDVQTDGDMKIGEPTPTLSDGVYSDAAAELIFVVEGKEVKSKRKF